MGKTNGLNQIQRSGMGFYKRKFLVGTHPHAFPLEVCKY
jgi:hypothetical protein